jgi:hypothetical protein
LVGCTAVRTARPRTVRTASLAHLACGIGLPIN